MTYGCHNRPRPGDHTETVHQVGFNETSYAPVFFQVPVYALSPHVMTRDCQYTLSTVDAGCNGCQWQVGGAVAGRGLPTARTGGTGNRARNDLVGGTRGERLPG